MWMLSTKMLPPVGVLVPIYLIFRKLGLLDTRIGLVIVLMLDQPADHRLDALHLFQGNPRRNPGSGKDGRGHVADRNPLCADADGDSGHRLDGAFELHPRLERSVLDAQPDRRQRRAADRVHRQLFKPRRACFTPNSRAASTMAIAPILIMGWFSQKQLVRGLTFGAVK